MAFNVSFGVGISAIVLFVLAALLLHIVKKCRFSTIVQIITVGIFLSTTACLYPVFMSEYTCTSFVGCLETLFVSIVNALQIFTINAGISDLLGKVENIDFFFKESYIFLVTFLSVIAPILTASFLLSLFFNLSVKLKFIFGCFKDTYVFSELNERSLTLASDIRRNHKKAMIIFTDVLEKEEETFFDLSTRAKSINALLFKDDILTVNFNYHDKSSQISYFIMGANETENIDQTLSLIERYRERELTRIYIFSSTCESELALSGIDKGKLKVRRINEVQSLINHTLYESGDEIFESAIENEHVDTKNINAVIIGMGNYGTEMIKALAWYCQMDGYKVTIDAFDMKKSAEDEFKALCPDLMSPKYNGVFVKGESEYTIRIHSGIDVNSSEILNIFKTLDKATYVFVSIGSDEENVKVAANMRMAWRRLGASPIIQAVVKNAKTEKILENAANFKGQKYNLQFTGNLEQSYSESVIIDSELEAKALKRHLFWDPKSEDGFWAFEYNYRSSIASVIHKKARGFCRIKNDDKLTALYQKAEAEGMKQDDFKKLVKKELGDECKPLQMLEHRRWNAYMRGEGYEYAEIRDDLAKTHHLLVNFYSLPPEEQDKDIW